MSRLRIALNGARGRMGAEIMELCRNSEEFYICATLDNKISEKNYDTFTRLYELSSKKPDVVIDFSSPKGTMDLSKWCAEHKIPLVVGTTGFSTGEEKKIQVAALKTPVFKSANFSVGINALNVAMQLFAQKFGPAEVQIEEIHHKHKKDNPSGTALFLKSELEGKAKLKITDPVGLRGGEVFGIHKIFFFGSNEWVSFEHHAQNRKTFAEGALKVAKWLVRKKPGLYGMNDFLGGDKK